MKTNSISLSLIFSLLASSMIVSSVTFAENTAYSAESANQTIDTVTVVADRASSEYEVFSREQAEQAINVAMDMMQGNAKQPLISQGLGVASVSGKTSSARSL